MNAILHMADMSGDNIENAEGDEKVLTKRRFVAQTKQLGKTEGLGSNARPALFALVNEATREGIVEKRDEVAHYFALYAQASAEARGAEVVEQKSVKQQISKLGVAFKMGQLTHVNTCDIVTMTLEAHAAQLKANGKNDYSAYDALVKVGREQVKFKDTPLTREVIDALICRPVKADVTEADALEKLANALDAFANSEDAEWSEESRDVCTEGAAALMKQIKALGGSTKMQREAEKLRKRTAQDEVRLAALADLGVK